MPQIAYELIRSRRKTISITIVHDASVVVRAPLRTPKAEITGFVEQKRHWILEKQQLVKQRAEAHKTREFKSGEEFLFLGHRLMLALSDKVTRVEAIVETLAFPRAELAHAEELIRQWYIGQARVVLGERVRYCSAQSGIVPRSISINGARHRWGSCGASGSLNFTWRLIMAPVEVIDYVVVHELSHIEHHNHSKSFWALVRDIMPDYKVKEKWLKDNSALLKLF